MTELEDELLITTGASAITGMEAVQTLWSGYGQIKRYLLKAGKFPSVIVKHIHWSEEQLHPKGWNTDISHQRKLKSYQVELNWYQKQARRTNHSCRVPQVFKSVSLKSEILLIMEDLDVSGFSRRLRPENVTLMEVKNCLSWLAHFHASFMGASSEGLWCTGTYWHLDTRPDEWAKMSNKKLKKAAKLIDQKLKAARFQTLVHGDAKLANFCFDDKGAVAAVDFQYVGRGCGIKDVAYLISSCFEDDACEKHESDLLNHYFNKLELALDKSIDFQKVKEEWLMLYRYSWADFYRFLDGWSPGHWKMHGYSERLSQQVINELNQ